MKKIIILSFILFILVSCEKDPIPPLAPLIRTGNASAVEKTTATVGVSITDISKTKEIGVLYSTSSTSLTLTDAKKGVVENFKIGNNTVFLTAISAGTLYYYKAYACNGVDYIYGEMKTFGTGGLQDIDGNVYNTLIIGSQTWMKENLKTTKYRNGQSIPNVTNATSWSSLSTGAWCDNNNDPSNGSYYGKLYNWYAVNDTRNIAPSGWHVPTDVEWTILENYLIANGYNYDGTTTGNKIAKSLATTTDWNTSTNTGAIGTDLTKNNKSGFSGLPGGLRYWSDGVFWDLDIIAYWWTNSAYNSVNAWMRGMGTADSELGRFYYGTNNGLSVRCIKD